MKQSSYLKLKTEQNQINLNIMHGDYVKIWN